MLGVVIVIAVMLVIRVIHDLEQVVARSQIGLAQNAGAGGGVVAVVGCKQQLSKLR